MRAHRAPSANASIVGSDNADANNDTNASRSKLIGPIESTSSTPVVDSAAACRVIMRRAMPSIEAAIATSAARLIVSTAASNPNPRAPSAASSAG